jgi:HSP20 family protein
METIRFPNFTNFQSLFQELERMRSEIDRVFAGLVGQTPLSARSGVFPAINTIGVGDKIIVQAELPGVKPEDIEISVEGNALSLRGERKRDDMSNVNYHRRERAVGRFHKVLALPVEIDPEAVEAKFEHGVLTLVLPKAEHAKSRRIPIRTGGEIANSSSIVDVQS